MHRGGGYARRRQQSRPGISLKNSETTTSTTASVAFVEGKDVADGRAVVYDRLAETWDLRAVLERDAKLSSRVGRVTVLEVEGVRTILRRRSRGLRTEFVAEVRATNGRTAAGAVEWLMREISRASAMSQTTLEICVTRRPAPANPDPSLVQKACEELEREGYETVLETLWNDASDADLHLALDADGRDLFHELEWTSVIRAKGRGVSG